MTPTYQKAKLNIDGKDIECLFNPQTYTVNKVNLYTFKPNQSKDVPDAEFGGGAPMEFHIDLLLDTSLTKDKSVTEQANDIIKGFHGKGSAPKFVIFSWGANTLPECAPTSLSIQYTMFRPDGSPIRAFVQMILTQAKEASDQAQNPTTRAIEGLRVHRVTDGDSLPSIAYQSYGDATRWRVIAEANGVNDPLRLRRGTELTIPRIDT